MADRASIVVLADFTPGNLVGCLANDTRVPQVNVRVGPVGRGIGLVAAARAGTLSPEDHVILWTRAECVSGAFTAMVDGAPDERVDVLADVDRFAAEVLALASSVRTVLVPSWVMPHATRGGLLAMRDGGLVNTLMRMNLRLVEGLADAPNAYVLDSAAWLQTAGADAYSPRLWHMAKIPFGGAVFKSAVADVKGALRAIAGASRKLVVVDLDNTLWGGVLGDDGPECLRVGGHDPVGEAHADFQRALKGLTRRGIVLGIVSKNDEASAIDALGTHPEMVLRPGDFAGWRINWEDKARNVAALAAELNLGLDAVVFIDDSPVERSRVREALPGVLVPEWPASPLLYPTALAALDCFEAIALTDEDRSRAAAYRTARERARERDTASSLDEWLQGLEIRIDVTELTDTNVARVAQLLNKTNQMNLSTRRLTGPELRAWASAPGHKLWAFRLRDKFEDAGVTGILSLALGDEDAQIVDFVLSCRVMGRQLEQAMLYQAMHYARRHGKRILRAEYIPTPRNAPCLRFLEQAGFENGDGHSFRWDLDRRYAFPRHVELTGLAG